MTEKPNPKLVENVRVFQNDMLALKSAIEGLGMSVSTKEAQMPVSQSMTAKVKVPDIKWEMLLVYLSRIGQAISKLQEIFEPDNALGLVPSCDVHGDNVPIVSDGTRTICLKCLLASAHWVIGEPGSTSPNGVELEDVTFKENKA